MFNFLNRYELGDNRKTDRLFFTLIFILAVGFALFCQYFFYGWGVLGSYTTALYSLSYMDCGFCSRVLVGTVYLLLCRVFPWLFGWKGLFYYVLAGALIFDLCLYAFFLYLQRKASLLNYKPVYILGVFAMIFLIPSFSCCENLGKPDTVQMMIVMLQVYLLMERKAEWLIPPLSFVNVCIHEGYFCMTANVVFCILLLLATDRRENRLKYWILWIANLIIMAVPSVYFVFKAPSLTKEVFDKLYEMSVALNKNGRVHVGLLLQRVKLSAQAVGMAGQTTNDAAIKATEVRRLWFVLLMLVPYAVYLIRETVRLIRTSRRGWFYALYLGLGLILGLVEFFIFCDFGRYFMWLAFFFTSTLGFAFCSEKDYVSVLHGKSTGFLILVCAYTLLLVPMYSCTYSPWIDILIYKLRLGI